MRYFFVVNPTNIELFQPFLKLHAVGERDVFISIIRMKVY